MDSGTTDKCELFSVFVGHLSQDTSRKDVVDLFSGCGHVEDFFIVENQRQGAFNYGFVRYKEMDSAVKAVKDLHRWPLKGTKLVVDLAKDTFERIQKEKKPREVGNLLDMKMKKNQVKEAPQQTRKSSTHIQDALYLSRVKETCVSLNMDVKLQTQENEQQHLHPIDVDTLLEDIMKTDQARVPSKDGDLPQELNAEKVKVKLLDSDGSTEIGREKVKDFVGALNTVMSTITKFLNMNSFDIVNQTEADSKETSLNKSDIQQTTPDTSKVGVSGEANHNSLTDNASSDGDTQTSFKSSIHVESNLKTTQESGNGLEMTGKGTGKELTCDMDKENSLVLNGGSERMQTASKLKGQYCALNMKPSQETGLCTRTDQFARNYYEQRRPQLSSETFSDNSISASVAGNPISCATPMTTKENHGIPQREEADIFQSSVIKNYFVKVIAGRGRSFNRQNESQSRGYTSRNPGWRP